MRALFAAISTPGFLFPQIGIAHKWRATGYETAFATGQEWGELLRREGLERLPRGDQDGPSFEVDGWATTPAIMRQVAHLEEAVRRFSPDVIVASQLALGALIVAEVYRLPVAMLGMPFDIWPTEDNPHGEMWGTLRKYRAAREAMGLPCEGRHDSVACLKGDLLMLRAPEAWVTQNGQTTNRVVAVGSQLYEPDNWPDSDADDNAHFEDWFMAAQKSGEPLIYVQPGRSFDLTPWLTKPLTAIEGTTIRAVISLARFDGDKNEINPLAEKRNDRLFCGEHLPLNSLLPHADLVVSGGHTTSVLAAMKHRLPILCIAAGSRSDWLAARVHQSGIGRRLDARNVSSAEIAEAIQSVMSSNFSSEYDQLNMAEIDIAPLLVDLVKNLHKEGIGRAAS